MSMVEIAIKVSLDAEANKHADGGGRGHRDQQADEAEQSAKANSANISQTGLMLMLCPTSFG